VRFSQRYTSFKSSYSLRAIAFIFLFLIVIASYLGLWKQNRIIIDGPSYYTYLPATFIHHDLKLNFIDKDPGYYKDKIWYYKIENGNKLIKHPLGLSVALSPVFLIGHFTAGISGATQDGYSLPYQNAMTIGVWAYLCLGLFYLRKLLLCFFSDKITAFTLLTIVIGTNLLWYSTFEGLMPHAVSFALTCICMYNFFSWLKLEKQKYLFCFALCFGLMVLIRPLAITTIIYFLMLGIGNKGGIKSFVQLIKPRFKQIILASLISFAIVSLQFFYWKYITGKWIYDVYIDEHFIFNSPKIIPFLFSFRKGIFIYTPVLFFALIGLITFYKTNKAIFYSTLTVSIISIFILSSWWAWSYGISWGIRPFIDYYSFLSLPIAAGFNYVFTKNNIIKISAAFILFSFISLNLFQSWQYKKGLIHYDDMSKEAYLKGFLQTTPSMEWYDLLKPYNWERRIAGLPQIEYSETLIQSIGVDKAIYFRGSNMNYFSLSEQNKNMLTCNSGAIGNSEKFFLTYLQGDVVAIKTQSGRYLSVKLNNQSIIAADSYTIGENEQFILTVLNKNDNRITLRTLKNKYLSVEGELNFLVLADKESTGTNEIFRLFLLEDYQHKQ